MILEKNLSYNFKYYLSKWNRLLLYNDLQKIQAPLMRIYSLFGGWPELQIPLKTQHLLYEIVLVISGLQKGFAMFLIQEEGGGVFFS